MQTAAHKAMLQGATVRNRKSKKSAGRARVVQRPRTGTSFGLVRPVVRFYQNARRLAKMARTEAARLVETFRSFWIRRPCTRFGSPNPRRIGRKWRVWARKARGDT